jgi:creatinine amidohydrolase/Fe(II)-dependent formamide hydrolase-like protein
VLAIEVCAKTSSICAVALSFTICMFWLVLKPFRLSFKPLRDYLTGALADPKIPVGHADGFTTSISLYLRPESVRKDQVTNLHSREVDWNNPNLDFARYSSTGVIGDPTYV